MAVLIGRDNPQRLVATDLGRMGYARALAVQREANRAVSQGVSPPTLLLVEHDPVITVTHRKEAWDHLLATPKKLEALGIDVQLTDRGGDVTYHGPGQLVAYPILRLNPLGLNLGSYMRLLEQVVIDVLDKFGVMAVRDKGATGVWVRVRGGGAGIRGWGAGFGDRGTAKLAPRYPTPETRYPPRKNLCAGRARAQEHHDARPGAEHHDRP